MSKNFTLNSQAQTIEQDIRANRLLDVSVDWADDLIYPAYDGLSIRNIPHSISHILDAPFSDDVTLDERVWGENEDFDDVQRVVFFLSDGLGYLYLQELMEEDAELEDAVAQLTDGRGFVPLTSIAPSTTAVALPTLWTGATPATHGMVGTGLFLREYSSIVEMITNTAVPSMKRNMIPDDHHAEFLPVKRLPKHLSEHRVPTHMLLLHTYLRGGFLSSVLQRDVQYSYAHGGHSDFWVRLAEVLHETSGQRAYVNVYYGAVDSLSHMYGAKNQYIHYEIKQQVKQLLEVLSSQSVQDGQTLFILTADHGHANAPHLIDLQAEDSEPIRRQLRFGLTGDTRLGHLHLQNESTEDVINQIHSIYGENITAIETSNAIDSGLFGHDTIYSETKHRLGDVILIPRLGTQIVDSSLGVLPLESWHGGISEDEMLVPFIYKRL